MPKRDASNFQNGLPELLLLRFLAERERYAYELLKKIPRDSERSLSYGEGCIYPLLHRLERTRLLTSRRALIKGRTRAYYRLTNRGLNRLAELRARWEQVVNGAALILGQRPGRR